MRREEYACPNGCSLPPRKKQLREYRNGTYGFDFYDFTFCPCCGSLMPYSLKKLKGFFEVYNIHAALSDAVQLIYKSEFKSAAREAFVAVENYLNLKKAIEDSTARQEKVSQPEMLLSAKDLQIQEYDDALTARIIEKITVRARNEIEIRFIGGYKKTMRLA